MQLSKCKLGFGAGAWGRRSAALAVAGLGSWRSGQKPGASGSLEGHLVVLEGLLAMAQAQVPAVSRPTGGVPTHLATRHCSEFSGINY